MPVNLALHKPATASATEPGHKPSDAVDGDPTSTRWCPPDNGAEHWWQVDLLKPEELTGVTITWEKEGKRYQYKIESSMDGTDWKMLVDASQNEKRTQLHQHPLAATARYLRLTLTGVETMAWGSFFEFEVLGTKSALKSDPDAVLLGTENAIRNAVTLPAGFEMTLFAFPPDISYPTTVTATPSGDLFVGVDGDGSVGHDKGRGWIVRCRDTDGDGRADQFSTFARVDSVRGMIFTGDKLFVLHPPKLSVYEIRPDGTAGPEKILLSGLGGGFDSPRGADHTTNGIRMGIDGWIYIAAGDFGFFHAKQADGKEFQLHGGGIVRVRPDGTGLELYTRGTRNIYDVAVDPQLNVFTRDNTNDGDGWNVRLNHDIQSANMGYPSFYKNFINEMLPPLLDTGGGSPTGALFLDEPGFPKSTGSALYTCEWGRGLIHRHPLEPNGASFKAGEVPFVKIERPTDLDVDGDSHLFIASWRGAQFNYNGINVGFIIRLTPTGHKPVQFPNLSKASNAELIQFLSSPSQVLRLHTQYKILRRGDSKPVAKALESLAASDTAPLAGRVAALFTLKQLQGARSTDALLRLVPNDTLREFALRALSDRLDEMATVPTDPFVRALSDKNPRVRLQAVIGLGRLGRSEVASAMVPRVADADPGVAHCAVQNLALLHAADACWKYFDTRNTREIRGCILALQLMHEPEVVKGAIARLAQADEKTYHPLLQLLCRLYYREADWNGQWWSTRPDTTGPYYKRARWEQTDAIATVLKNVTATADSDTVFFLLTQCQRYSINSGELGISLLAMVATNPKLQSPAVDVLGQQSSLSPDEIAFLEKIAVSEPQDPGLQMRAYEALLRFAGNPGVLNAMFHVLTEFSKIDKPDFSRAREEFVRDNHPTKNIAYFVKKTESGNREIQQLAFEILLHIKTDKNKIKAVDNLARETIAAAWDTSAAVPLLQAIGQAHATSYSDQVEKYRNDPRADVAAAATKASTQLSHTNPTVVKSGNGPLIRKLPYEEVLVQAAQEPGDPKLGAQLFETVGCIKCHTTTKDEPIKGPFLGDISARYKRMELAESVLRPNAKIAQGFITNWFVMKNSDEYEGFIVRESGDDIELRNLAGDYRLAKKDIAQRGSRETSIMPTGLVDDLTVHDLASILAYLDSLNKK